MALSVDIEVEKKSKEKYMMRQKMSRQERAKQFAPFDALKGLNDALRTVEAEHEKKLKNAVTLAQEVDAEDII